MPLEAFTVDVLSCTVMCWLMRGVRQRQRIRFVSSGNFHGHWTNEILLARDVLVCARLHWAM